MARSRTKKYPTKAWVTRARIKGFYSRSEVLYLRRRLSAVSGERTWMVYTKLEGSLASVWSVWMAVREVKKPWEIHR